MTDQMQNMTKARMLELVSAGRAEFEALIAQLSERQMVGIELRSGETVKDVLAHITAWESELSGWLQAAVQGQTVPIPRFTDEYVNSFNERVYIDNRERTLAEVRSEFEQVHHDLWVALNALPDAADDPQWKLWRNGQAPWLLIAGNTYDHYKDHIAPIEALIKR
jgi:hypothetical protein